MDEVKPNKMSQDIKIISPAQWKITKLRFMDCIFCCHQPPWTL